MNHYGNGQIVLNYCTAVRVTVGKGGVYGMTESREGYENPTYLSGLRFKDTPSCSTKPCLSPHNPKRKAGLSTVQLYSLTVT